MLTVIPSITLVRMQTAILSKFYDTAEDTDRITFDHLDEGVVEGLSTFNWLMDAPPLGVVGLWFVSPSCRTDGQTLQACTPIMDVCR